MERQLKIGDKIQRYEFGELKGSEMVIEKVTKTLAKSGYFTFYKKISDKGEVERKGESFSLNKRYYVLTHQ